MNSQPMSKALRIAEVLEITGLSKTMIYRMVRRGAFPAPFKPGGVSSRWSEAEVRAWREAKEQARVA